MVASDLSIGAYHCCFRLLILENQVYPYLEASYHILQRCFLRPIRLRVNFVWIAQAIGLKEGIHRHCRRKDPL